MATLSYAVINNSTIHSSKIQDIITVSSLLTENQSAIIKNSTIHSSIIENIISVGEEPVASTSTALSDYWI